ncbi:translation initiation factor eIF-2B subunit beta [Cimex lectularius]|uniref:Translation initiation factor eIF2B subunit beta n=1 Tax=Cimex lectularius TaxID=79782 RepID=A0A8I6SEA9_CIMLE|nr:translation initiation factor eIF-2B subunit beta [Cimex lectularius]
MSQNKAVDVERRIDDFLMDYECCKQSDSLVLEAVKVFSDVINYSKWETASELLDMVKKNGRKIMKQMPMESSVGNIVRRILKIIREEYMSLDKNKQDETYEESLHKIVTSEGNSDDYSKVLPRLGPAIVDHLNELELEVETSSENISQQAVEHIHSNEIIMTLGMSDTVLKFLKEAAKKRKFEVIVSSTEPSKDGNCMALKLSKLKIRTTLIPDSAIFGIMSRVNKVIIGTHTVMADGGLRSSCGTRLVALAATHYSVPVLVLAPLYQLSPKYYCSPEQNSFNSFISPEGVLAYSDGDLLTKVHTYNPRYDYVPPDLVTLFISNSGGHAPSYVYRHLSELYHPEDSEL